MTVNNVNLPTPLTPPPAPPTKVAVNGDAALQKMDADHDGFVTKEEYVGYQSAARHEAQLALGDQVFAAHDANHDGSLDATEQAGLTLSEKGAARAYDRAGNGNGVLTHDELLAGLNADTGKTEAYHAEKDGLQADVTLLDTQIHDLSAEKQTLVSANQANQSVYDGLKALPDDQLTPDDRAAMQDFETKSARVDEIAGQITQITTHEGTLKFRMDALDKMVAASGQGLDASRSADVVGDQRRAQLKELGVDTSTYQALKALPEELRTPDDNQFIADYDAKVATIAAEGQEIKGDNATAKNSKDAIASLDATSKVPSAELQDSIAGMYRTYLGREPEPGAVNQWAAATGGDVAAIEKGISESPEATQFARTAAITDLYKTVLGRDPDAAGLDFWNKSGLSVEDVKTAIENSPEGLDKARTDGITAIYQDVLGRAPDADGLAYWKASAMSVDEVKTAIQNSPEALARA